MKIYAFGVRDDEKQAFEQISAQCGVEVTLSDETPSLENADLVKGYEGVTALGMGNIDRDLLSRYSENGVRFLSTRTIGYNHIDLVAAKELGITDQVQVEYVCGGQFYGDADITAYMDTWYGTKGVEAVFACGGGIYTSAAEAAAKVGGKVIGVDTDQAAIIDKAGEGLTITSAMKGLGTTVTTVLTDIKADKWSNYGGKIDKLGLVSENADENFVQLPVESTQWNDGFTEDDYHALVKSMYDGDIKVSNDITAMPKTEITVNDYGSIK
mgnify:CR=1 FL=1